MELYSGDLSRLEKGSEFVGGDRKLTVKKTAPGRKGLVNVWFEGIGDRNDSDFLRGIELEIPESSLPPAPEGTYYHYQIVGSSVVDMDGRQVGSVSGIMETGANDVYVVSQPDGGDILIAATRETIREVDTVNRVITVDLPTKMVGTPVVEDEDREDRH